MATKSSTKKGSAKKSSKKSSKKPSSKKASIIFPPPNLRCIEACATQYGNCLRKGVDPKLCLKRFMRCLQSCFTGGAPTPDEG